MNKKNFRLLEVDLTHQKSKVVNMTTEVKKYLGGRSLGAKLLWDWVPPQADPMSEENILYFGIGPLTGLLGSVTNVSAKSPLTMLRGHSNCNGHFGKELIYAGYNAGILFTGKASKLVYLYVNDDQVQLRDASHLSGKSGLETQYMLNKELREDLSDQNFRFISIGPAGENMVNNADISHDFYHHAARLGMGKIMGSKKLKAIAIKGTKSPDYAHPEIIIENIKRILFEGRQYIAENRRWGHTSSMSRRYYEATEGIKNKQKGWDDICDLFNPILLEQSYKIWGDSCHGCPVACKVPYFVSQPPLGPFTGELRHDNAGGWSANAMIPGYEQQGYLCSYVDYLGLDGEDVSGVITWMMECYEKGLVTKEDLEGIELTWGNVQSICALLKKIAYREGIGNILADGLKFAPEKMKKGADKYALTNKGVAITSHEPRGSMNDALALSMTAVGEIHGDRGSPERIMYDTMTSCTFWRRYITKIFGSLYDWALPMLEATSNLKYTAEEWDDLVMRAYHMERCYSIREGYVPARDDILPERFFREIIYNKYNEPKILNKDEFYEKRKERYLLYGLREDGFPAAEVLEKLGLEFTIDAVEKASYKQKHY